MEDQLSGCVHNSLSLGLYDNARFLAERLVAASGSEENKLLLATCYRHCNQGYRAVHLLKGSNNQQCRYLAALCCMDLRRYTEAESLLLSQGEPQVPNGAAGWYLLGRISRFNNNMNRAAECYVRALHKDPMLWVAFAELCALGKPDLTAEFANPAQMAALQRRLSQDQQQQPPVNQQQHPHQQGLPVQQQQQPQHQHQQPHLLQQLQQQQQQHLQHPAVATGTPNQAMSIDSEDGPTPTHPTPDIRQSDVTPSGPGAFAAGHTPQLLSFVTPSPQATALGAPPVPQKGGLFPGFPEPPSGNRTPTLVKHKQPVGVRMGPTPAAGAAPCGGGRGRKAPKAAGRLFANDGSITPRRSARLAAVGSDGGSTPIAPTPAPLGRQDPNQQHPPAAARQRQQQRRNGIARVSDGSNDSENAPAGDRNGAAVDDDSFHWQDIEPPAAKTQQQSDQLLSVFLPLSLAMHHLSQYKCKEALAALSKLPQQQLASPGVLLLMGRCLYELVDYSRAAEAFEAARAADPFNLEGMEYYSTVLWQLKRDVELAHLAQHAIAVDRLAPEAWCVAGNCYSLQREHESAVSLFKRALQLQPHMAYAATLMGHEYLASEDLAAATTAYQHALRSDGKHYNALYGLGQIYMKQEKYIEALTHFDLAARINPSSSVLRCCCGTALRRMCRLEDALKQLKVAIAIDNRNPLARFEAAGVLTSLERHEEALQQLQQLAEIVPRESAVYFVMGKLHKRLGHTDKALAALNIALDLKPLAGDRAAIKAAIDKVYLSEDDEEEEL